MATTVTFTGQVILQVSGNNALAGDQSGNVAVKAATFSQQLLVAATGNDIVAGGGYEGQFTCPTTGGTLNLADSTNICKTGAVGTILPSQGYIVTAVKKLKVLFLQNNDAVKVVTVTMPATLGLAGLGYVANQVVAVLQPGGAFCSIWPTGSSVLTAGTNDALVFTSDAGTPQVTIAAYFG